MSVPFQVPVPVPAPPSPLFLAPCILRQVHHAVRSLLLSRPLSLSVPLASVMALSAGVTGSPLGGCGTGRSRRRVERELSEGGRQVEPIFV